jgi:hypothetical protein
VADTVKVNNADDMDDETFLKHMYLRHPLVRFQTRGEHDANHRLQPTKLHEHRASVRTAKKSAEQLL